MAPIVTARKPAGPKPPQVIVNAICDSRRWDHILLRAGDVIIATPGKSGTTWVQQIVGELIFEGEGGVHFLRSPCPDHVLESPWKILHQLGSQEHRRFIKTHLPAEALPYDRGVKYIFVGRDVRDMVWSAHHQLSNFTDHALGAYNDRPDRVGPPIVRPADVRSFYHSFLATGETPTFSDGRGPWSLWEHYRGWWQAREVANILLIHFNQLKTDLQGAIRRIAAFLEIAIDEASFPTIVEHCGIDYMRAEACRLEMLDRLFVNGGADFVHKGTNGRWKAQLSEEEIAMCDALAIERLGPECARWLSTGEGAYDGDRAAAGSRRGSATPRRVGR